jgi:hypothetical protein
MTHENIRVTRCPIQGLKYLKDYLFKVCDNLNTTTLALSHLELRKNVDI